MSIGPIDIRVEGQPESVVPSEYNAPQPPAQLALSKRKRDELAKWICRSIKTARSDQGRAQFLTHLAQWNDAYEGTKTPKSFPWERASNVHVPLTAWTVQSVTDRVTRSIFTADPMMLVKPLYDLPAEQESWPKLHEAWLQDKLRYNLSMMTMGRSLVKASVKDGLAVAQLSWQEREKRIYTWIEKGGKLTLSEENVTFRGPELDMIDLEDFEVYPANSPSIDQAIGCVRRIWLRWDDLKRGEKEGRYQNVDLLKETKDQWDNESVRSRQDAIEGLGEPDGQELADKLIEVYEGPWRYDVDGDGFEEEILITVAVQQEMLLSARYYPFAHGQRYFHPFRIMRRPGRLYGESMAGKVYDLNVEVDTIHNQRMDSTTILLAPIFTVIRQTLSTLGGPRNIPFYPGAFIPVDNHEDIRQLTTTDIKSSAVTEEQQLLAYAEQLTGATDIAMGRPATGQHTATEINQSTAGSNARTEEMVSTFQETMPRLCEQLVALYLQYDEAVPDFLRLPVSYVPAGSATALNEEYRRQQALMVYGAMMQNPIVMSNPAFQWSVTRDMLNAFGKARDIEGYIGKEPQPQMMLPGMVPGQPGGEMGSQEMPNELPPGQIGIGGIPGEWA